ncbi:uncharacterized protein LOC107359456 [Tetranychus urticae]|uniref:Uncharacterized protein n=1 Tax=Tetranychus urticae TaxID=32264 RepID=T1K317_TETUR|nr:uncharacterized protein LOC107359456 [Tetranychus urticae]
MKFTIILFVSLLVCAFLIHSNDCAIRISRRKLKLLKKLAVILFLGKNRKIYTVPFPLPLPLPVINKVQPIIYRQRVPYPVEVPVPVPYAEPVPYPVEVPIDDHPYDDYSDDEADAMETRGYGYGSPINNNNINRYHQPQSSRVKIFTKRLPKRYDQQYPNQLKRSF